MGFLTKFKNRYPDKLCAKLAKSLAGAVHNTSVARRWAAFKRALTIYG